MGVKWLNRRENNSYTKCGGGVLWYPLKFSLHFRKRGTEGCQSALYSPLGFGVGRFGKRGNKSYNVCRVGATIAFLPHLRIGGSGGWQIGTVFIIGLAPLNKQLHASASDGFIALSTTDGPDGFAGSCVQSGWMSVAAVSIRMLVCRSGVQHSWLFSLYFLGPCTCW